VGAPREKSAPSMMPICSMQLSALRMKPYWQSPHILTESTFSLGPLERCPRWRCTGGCRR